MLIGPVDLDHEVLVVAEIGNNHEGSYALAEEMIGRAAEAGAKAVKFQTFVPERLVAANDEQRLATLRRFQLSQVQFENLAKTAKRSGILFLSTPFDLECIEWLSPLVPAFKIASGDNDYTVLLRAIAATGKAVVLSTGLATVDDIAATRDLLHGEWNKHGIQNPGLVLLHCVSSYPTAPTEADLTSITTLQKFRDTVGYSDHTLGMEAAIAAVAIGARLIEKHFTLDKNQSSFRDHKLSADPAEFAEMVRRIKILEQMMRPGNRAAAAVHPNYKTARRGAYAARDLDVGAELSVSDLVYLRPRSGLSPADIDYRVGTRLTRRARAGEPITIEHFSK